MPNVTILNPRFFFSSEMESLITFLSMTTSSTYVPVAESFKTGNGSFGIGLPRNWQIGPQPSFRFHTYQAYEIRSNSSK